MHWRHLVLLLLAGTAGCNSFAGPGTETQTVTPAPVPTPPPTPEDPRVGIAPGLSADAVFDVHFLADRHEKAVRRTSYVWRESDSPYERYEGLSTNASVSQIVTVERSDTYTRVVPLKSFSENGHVRYYKEYEEFARGEVEYQKWRSKDGDGNAYRRRESVNANRTYAAIAAEAIRRYLDVDEETVTRVDVGERPHYRVVGTRDSFPVEGSVENYRARAVVREDGFVRRLNVTYTIVRFGEQIETGYSFQYTEVGNATVETPEWLPAARERTGEETASRRSVGHRPLTR